jgi:hypothetical protein
MGGKPRELVFDQDRLIASILPIALNKYEEKIKLGST